MIGQARFHRGRHADSLVYAAEIIVDKVNGERGLVVLQTLGEPIGEAGESAHLHPHGQVVALGMACADLRQVGLPHDSLAPGRNDGRRTIHAGLSIAIDLDQHPVVDAPREESGLNSDQVSAVAVRRELHTLRESRLKLAHEAVGRECAPVACVPCAHELGGSVGGNPRPSIAVALRGAGWREIGCLASDEGVVGYFEKK